MAYYFMVESKKGNFTPLEISNSPYFQIIDRKYNKKYAYSLDEIDSFTTMFNNEQELRNILLSEGILSQEFRNKPLSTRFLNKGDYQKVRYDFLYQKDLEYIANPTKVLEFIMQKYYQNDFIFLKKFANNFSKYYECSSTAPEVLQASISSIREGKRNSLFESIDLNGDLLVTRLVKLLILKHTENPDGTITYQNKVNYRNLHSVIAYINNYFYKQEPILEPIKEFESIKKDNPQPEIVVKTKTRKKVLTPLEGQFSFPI